MVICHPKSALLGNGDTLRPRLSVGRLSAFAAGRATDVEIWARWPWANGELEAPWLRLHEVVRWSPQAELALPPEPSPQPVLSLLLWYCVFPFQLCSGLIYTNALCHLEGFCSLWLILLLPWTIDNWSYRHSPCSQRCKLCTHACRLYWTNWSSGLRLVLRLKLARC